MHTYMYNDMKIRTFLRPLPPPPAAVNLLQFSSNSSTPPIPDPTSTPNL